MTPNNDNLALLRGLLDSIGFSALSTEPQVSHLNAGYAAEVGMPEMADLITEYRSGRRAARIQEIFVRQVPPDGGTLTGQELGDDFVRVALILAVRERRGVWRELYEFDQIAEHFRKDIRAHRIRTAIE